MSDEKHKIKSVVLTQRIIQKLVELNGARASEIADQLDVVPSTAYHHLSTLESGKFVVKEGDRYYPSMEFAKIGQFARTRKQGYVQAREKVKALSDETGARVHFAIEEHGIGRSLFTSRGEFAVHTFSVIGRDFPLHVTGAGKAILAATSEEAVLDIVENHGLKAETDNSITSSEELFDELDQIMEQGYAVNREEHIEGIRAVGAPVQTPQGEVLGALAVSGPARRITNSLIDEELSEVVPAFCNELELEIKHLSE